MAETKPRILIIDDDVVDRQLIIRALKTGQMAECIREAPDEAKALAVLTAETMDIIFLDYQLPGKDGLAVMHSLKALGIDKPVIMLTGHGDATVAVEVMKAGAYDYCPKNKITPEFLGKLITHSMSAYEARQQISQAEERIRKLAYYDTLTGLPNRTMFQEYITEQLKYVAEHQQLLALLYMDIDRFKFINNTWGHAVGDSLLKEISLRLRIALPEHFIARMGGDEFMVVLKNTSLEQANRLAKRILAVLEPVFIYQEYQFYITTSIGIVLYPEHGAQLDFLLRNADSAMYAAKNNGRNNYQLYNADMGTALGEAMALTNELRPALTHNEFVLYYQPKVSLSSGRISGAEALIRWQSPKYGMVGPDKFIKLAEETGFIITLGEWIFSKVCWQLRQWQRLQIPVVPIAVNFSPKQLFHQQTLDMIKTALLKNEMEPRYLEIEITESAALDNEHVLQQLLQEIRDMGIKVAIDDFGTGYATLHHIVEFAVDTLKIDRSFVREISQSNSRTKLLISTIISLAHNLGLSVVAEGVEVEEQRLFLAQNSCDSYQGYLYSKPVPADEFVALLRRQAGL